MSLWSLMNGAQRGKRAALNYVRTLAPCSYDKPYNCMLLYVSHAVRFCHKSSTGWMWPVARMRLCSIYRPPPSGQNRFKATMFLDEWSNYLDRLITIPQEVIIAGDLNFHFDDPTNINVRQVTIMPFRLHWIVRRHSIVKRRSLSEGIVLFLCQISSRTSNHLPPYYVQVAL